MMGYFGTRCTGWAIGSGPVESACQKVIGKRMNGDGMRRGEDEADAFATCSPCMPAETSSVMPLNIPIGTEQTVYP